MSIQYDDLLNADPGSNLIREQVNRVYAQGPVGSIESAMYNTLFGINHRQQPNSIPINKDYYGLTFFTRPHMNMTSANLRQSRLFTDLLNVDGNTMGRAIRAMLDTDADLYKHGSKLVDDYQAFIPLLTNQLVTMSGWPDIVAPTFTSRPGAYKEAFSLVDGVTNNYETYDITANFRNIQGDPITMLLYYWSHYSSLVFQGILVPYPQFIIENRIDYQTRIYRLVLDQSKRFVQKISACGAAFPIGAPIGAAMNFESTDVINRSNEQITIQFRCMGAMYQDPILIDEFNRTVQMHYSGMTDQFRETNLTKLDPDELGLFNNIGYPRIDFDTRELQWWVNNEDYLEMLRNVEDPDED